MQHFNFLIRTPGFIQHAKFHALPQRRTTLQVLPNILNFQEEFLCATEDETLHWEPQWILPTRETVPDAIKH